MFLIQENACGFSPTIFFSHSNGKTTSCGWKGRMKQRQMLLHSRPAWAQLTAMPTKLLQANGGHSSLGPEDRLWNQLWKTTYMTEAWLEICARWLSLCQSGSRFPEGNQTETHCYSCCITTLLYIHVEFAKNIFFISEGLLQNIDFRLCSGLMR